jgi:hypothetical protein
MGDKLARALTYKVVRVRIRSASVAHLEQYRKQAEDVPKTLWSLKELLAIPGPGAVKGDLQAQLVEAYPDYTEMYDWSNFGRMSVNSQQARILRLVFHELSENHFKHGVESSIAVISTDATNRLTVEFPLLRLVRGDDGAYVIHEHYKRLTDYTGNDISISMPPAVTSRGLSHGNGFYMMHVLLALINWELLVQLEPDLKQGQKNKMSIRSGEDGFEYGCLVVTMSPKGLR